MTVISEHSPALITLLIEVVGEEGDDDELPISEKKNKETFSNQNVTTMTLGCCETWLFDQKN